MHPLIFEQRIVPQRDKMFRFSLRILGNSEDARDLVQDALLKIWSQHTDLEVVQNAEAWCMRVVKNLCIDRLKAGKIRAEAAKNIQKDNETGYPTPYQEAERKDNMEIIRKLIDDLPEKFKMIIHLRDIEEFSYKEMADIMEISMEEVKVNLFRARKLLKDKLIKNHEYGLS